jgi:hypothetical protein
VSKFSLGRKLRTMGVQTVMKDPTYTYGHVVGSITTIKIEMIPRKDT